MHTCHFDRANKKQQNCCEVLQKPSTLNVLWCATQDGKDVLTGEKECKKKQATGVWLLGGGRAPRNCRGEKRNCRSSSIVPGSSPAGAEGTKLIQYRPVIPAYRSLEYSKLDPHLSEQRPSSRTTDPSYIPPVTKKKAGAEAGNRWEQQSEEVTFCFPEYASH